MKRILSLDWDYFINATAEQRLLLFPDGGNENISYDLQDFIWSSRYSNPELKEIKVLRSDYYKTFRIIIDNFMGSHIQRVAYPNREMLVTVSHKWIYDFIKKRTKKNEQFEVYNVDFHHDMYDLRTSEEEVNCGNWVNCLQEVRPNMKYHWIPREDSDIRILGGDTVPCEMRNLTDIEDLTFDYLFICRSDCWSPPHLDSYFEKLWVESNKYMPVVVEDRVKHCRKVSILSEVEEEFKLLNEISKIMRE